MQSRDGKSELVQHLQAMRILVAEDDKDQLAYLCVQLHGHFQLETADSGQKAWSLLKSGEVDLALLDIYMPVMDGVEVCRRLRAERNYTPLLLMTAANSAHLCVDGLNAGADDYMHKPLDVDELVARIHALMRRGRVATQELLVAGAIALDARQRQVTCHGKPLALTPREFKMLELFMRHPGRVFSRAELIRRLWDATTDTLEESVKAHIKGLRHKLGRAGITDALETVYGMGYRLAAKQAGQT